MSPWRWTIYLGAPFVVMVFVFVGMMTLSRYDILQWAPERTPVRFEGFHVVCGSFRIRYSVFYTDVRPMNAGWHLWPFRMVGIAPPPWPSRRP